MNATRRVTFVFLMLLVVVAGAGVFFTREHGPGEEPLGAAPTAASHAGAKPQGAAPAAAQGGAAVPGPAGPRARRTRLVDMRPLLTARQLSRFATTPEEQELSRQAERLADHAIDLAFVVAMRDATETLPEQTPELRAIADTLARAQTEVDAAQARVRELEEKVVASPERGRAAVGNQLEVARAELALDRDELAAASDALQRAGGDPQVRIRRLREVYDAAQKEPRPPVVTAPVVGPTSSVLERLRAWNWHRDALAQLLEARRDIGDRAQRLATRRADLTARMDRDAAAREATKSSTARLPSGTDVESNGAKDEKVKAFARYGDDQRRLAAVGRRLQDLQDLDDTYDAWIAVVEGHGRGALNRLLWGLLGLVGLLSVGFAAGERVDRFFRGAATEKLRSATLRTVARLAVNVVTVLLGLFVVFGLPGQATTVLGLAGAGLTVALKDFIVAFFGWFIRMGRNGIRVGDWVEIKGVGGEVVEIGLFRTVLFETGSGSDAGHPTGRRVSFVNSFAIEGHYFNFSTSGQWMWDELRLLVPLGRDPYPVIDDIRRLAVQETEANAKVAESEWHNTASGYRVKAFSAVPGIHVVPTGSGIEVVVRYITRAHERHEARRRLYQAASELIRGKRGSDALSPDASVGG